MAGDNSGMGRGGRNRRGAAKRGAGLHDGFNQVTTDW